MSDATITEAGPVEQGVRTFLAQVAHGDPALSALSLSQAKAVDLCVPGTREHSFAVEALRKLLDDLRDTARPNSDENDEFAALLGEVAA